MNLDEILKLVIQSFFDLMVIVIIPVCLKILYDIAELKTDMTWVKSSLKILGDKAGAVLHSPHTPEFDALIEKFWHDQLTSEEAKELCVKLSEIIHEDEQNPLSPGKPFTPGQKSTAIQMLTAVSAICRVKP